MTIYRSKTAQTGPEPYEPQAGHHRFSEAPSWCQNIDPHVPGFCTSALVGSLGNPHDLDVFSASVVVTAGQPILFVYLPEADTDIEVANTTADVRRLAGWMLTAADMADEARRYLPGE
jgi:hypothetical protein